MVAIDSSALRAQFQPSIDVARKACRRWGVTLDIADDADVTQAAQSVKECLQKAAEVACAFDSGVVYPSDFPGLVGGMPGLSLDAMTADIQNTASGSSGEIWGLAIRVKADELTFDVPIVYGIEVDAARTLLSLLDGRERDLVDIDAVSDATEASSVSLTLHADTWRVIKDLAMTGDVPLQISISFRRPVVWDLFRAELAQLPAHDLPIFSEEDFARRFMRSIRHDTAWIEGCISMLADYATVDAAPFSIEWQQWFPQMIEMLHAIGRPNDMAGISVVINFAVEEPREDGGWDCVALRTLLIACGLDPVGAYQVLESARMDPYPFYDLHQEEEKRFRLLGVSAIPDALLSAYRVSTTGRTEAYNEMARASAREDA